MPFAEFDGIRYHYGRIGSGTPVILITGLVGDTGFWNKTVPMLSDRFDVITVDNRGSGLTECGEDYTIEDMSEDVLRLMDVLNIRKAHILGWSMGSHIAMNLAANHPDRLISLTLVSSYLRRPGRSGYALHFLSRALEEGTVTAETAGVIMNILLRTEGFFQYAESRGKQIAPAPIGNENGIKHQMRAVDRYEPENDAVRITAPVFSIHGLDDIMTLPSCGDEVAAMIGNCRKLRVPDEGHVMRPESYIPQFIEFVSSFRL